MRLRVGSAVCIAAIGSLYMSSAQAAILFGGASAEMFSSASTTFGAGPLTVTDGANQTLVSLPLVPIIVSTPIVISHNNPPGPPVATATNTATTQVNFANSSLGSVVFTGTSTATVNNSPFGIADAFNNHDFSYTFTTTGQNYLFTLNYATSAANNAAAFNDTIFLSWTSTVTLGRGASGTISALLTPGTYSFAIFDEFSSNNLTKVGGPNGTITSSQSDVFDFSFTAAVPEPATWAMMMLGFAGLGFMGWRAKRKAVAAA